MELNGVMIRGPVVINSEFFKLLYKNWVFYLHHIVSRMENSNSQFFEVTTLEFW